MPLTIADLPDELLYLCVDGSARICVKLCGTNASIRYRIMACTEMRQTGLRLVCKHPYHASDIQQILGAHKFPIGEVILTSNKWWFHHNPEAIRRQQE